MLFMRNARNERPQCQNGNYPGSDSSRFEKQVSLPTRHRKKETQAFTCVELVVVLGVLALLGMLAVPLLASNRAHSDRATCQSNLRQIGRAFAMWADDHGGKYPGLISSSLGGINDNAQCVNSWFHFYWIREELGTPKILVCPSDTERRPASDWLHYPNGGFIHANYRHSSVSYLLMLGVLQAPHGVLSADRNVQPSGDGVTCAAGPLYSGARLDPQSPTLNWTPSLHNMSGNLLHNDGSVIAGGREELRTAVERSVQPGSRNLCTLYPN